ncbi:MAG: hypothetical protein PVG70_03285 [Desulfobacterales bacterium]
MQKPRFDILIKSQAGIGYIAILVLLAILSTMGLAFIYKVGIMSSVTLNRGTSMQAQYLAESAANHALWHMLNNPEFAPESEKYYMHSLGDGRYGYKVRKPTETTFATVATMGVSQDSVVNQSYVQYIIPSNVFTIYGTSYSPNPKYRRLIGAQWTDLTNIPAASAPMIHWAELEGCPIRKEIVAGLIDSNDDIQFMVWDGTAWGYQLSFATNAEMNYKCFDIAYESQSGNALVVGRYDGSTMVRYNVWDGTAWLYASAQPAFNLASGALRLVTMASCPGNDDILIATVNWNNELQLFRWNGAAFTDLGVIESSTDTDKHGIAQIVYEQQSGDALILWAARGAVRYLVWNGAALGTENTASGFINDVFVLRAAADPTSDTIVVAGIDKFYDITVAVWDGDAWIDYREVETSCANNAVQALDVAWEASGEDAVVAWSPWGLTNVRSIAWRKGTALVDSTVQEGPDLQHQPWLVRLHPIFQSEKIILLSETNSNDLRYCLWTGNQFKGNPAILLEPDISVQNDVAFDLAEANVPRTGGIGSGSGGNLPPIVDAGTDQVVYLPANATLDGTVSDDGLPNPPAAFTTTWSQISGPGTVVFGDVAQVDTTASFSAAGTYVLRLTANDGDLEASDEVTVVVGEVGGCNGRLLFVVEDATALTVQESQRKTLMEGWGWTVDLIDDDDTQANFDIQAAGNDVAYISQEALANALGNKLKETPIGVVNENSDMLDDLGFSTGVSMGGGLPTLKVDSNHYITSAFGTIQVAPYAANEWYQIVNEPVAEGVNPVGTWDTGKPALMTLSQGDSLSGGGTAAGRRVQIPMGSGQGATPVDINSISGAGRGLIRRSIEWAGGCDGCNPDYTPDTKTGEFSTTAYGSGSLEGLDFLPEGMSFNSTAVPADGALLSVDAADMFYMTDLSGNLLTSLAVPGGTPTGVTLVQNGAWADHLAVSDKQDDVINYFDFSGNLVGSFSTNVSADFDSATPVDVAFIGVTASGSYDNHLAIPDMGKNKVYLVDQSGTWVSSIDISGLTYGVSGAAHLPGTDKLLLVDSNDQAFIINFVGSLLNQYATAPFGTSSSQAVTFNPATCDHLIGDSSVDLIVTLNLAGGSDTDPPTPDPMTWATPPAAVDPTSIGMIATTATDPSGVEYYFECTSGGCHDSGWQDSTTYVDSGLSEVTLYTYRVKARDKSAAQNETGWSTEASATTPSSEIYVYDITMGFRNQGVFYYGQATVWIKDTNGLDISGAVVSGEWSGAVSGESMGNTGSDGKVMLESPSKKNGGTFTFTVNSVVKTGYTYNPGLNVEDSDTIIAP